MTEARGNARPLSREAGSALLAGALHPRGVVLAPIGVLKALARRGLVDQATSPSMAPVGATCSGRITAAGRERAREVAR